MKENKNASTAYKIIKTLALIVKEPVSINEILSSFEKEDIYLTKETVSKYFSTLRASGCKIQKRRNKFYINYPVLDFSEDELSTLADFQKTAFCLLSKKNYADFSKFIDKLFALSDDSVYEKYRRIFAKTLDTKGFLDSNTNSEIKNKIETISEFLTENPQKIKIMYEDKIYTITPVEFRIFKGSICLLGHCTKENINKNFFLDKIQDIEKTPQRALKSDFGLSTTFKITGRLKNAYILKDGETASEYGDYTIITNQKEDKDALLRRLLKYGTYCEILYPASDREKMKSLVNGLISKI